MAVDTTQDARKKFTMSKAQENLWSNNVARRIAEVDTKTMGTKYNPYASYPAINDGAVSGAAYNIADYDVDADSVQINRRADVSEHVNSYDWKSVDFDVISQRGQEFGNSVSKIIDGYVLTKPVGFSGVTAIDDGDFGGTDGNAKTSSNTVIDDIVNTCIEQVDVNDAHGKKKFMVVSPYEANDLRGFMQNNGFNTADDAIRSGVNPLVGTTFSGVDVYQTNNLRNVAVLGLATNPSDDDTIVINGVTITFKDTQGSAAGVVHIAGSVDQTRANLKDFLNDGDYPGSTTEAEGTNAGYNALDTADQYKLARVGLTTANNDSTDELTVTANATLVVSETLTDGSDTWGSVERQLVFGNYGSIFLGLPSQGMDYHEKEVSAKAGVELYLEQFYNSTIWTRMAPQVLTVKVN